MARKSRQLGRTVVIHPGDAQLEARDTGEVDRIEATLAAGEWESPRTGKRELLPARVRRDYERRLEELKKRREAHD